jgi:hypothetical protein
MPGVHFHETRTREPAQGARAYRQAGREIEAVEHDGTGDGEAAAIHRCGSLGRASHGPGSKGVRVSAMASAERPQAFEAAARPRSRRDVQVVLPTPPPISVARSTKATPPEVRGLSMLCAPSLVACSQVLRLHVQMSRRLGDGTQRLSDHTARRCSLRRLRCGSTMRVPPASLNGRSPDLSRRLRDTVPSKCDPDASRGDRLDALSAAVAVRAAARSGAVLRDGLEAGEVAVRLTLPLTTTATAVRLADDHAQAGCEAGRLDISTRPR